jgi:hypothetical protein
MIGVISGEHWKSPEKARSDGNHSARSRLSLADEGVGNSTIVSWRQIGWERRSTPRFPTLSQSARLGWGNRLAGFEFGDFELGVDGAVDETLTSPLSAALEQARQSFLVNRSGLPGAPTALLLEGAVVSGVVRASTGNRGCLSFTSHQACQPEETEQTPASPTVPGLYGAIVGVVVRICRPVLRIVRLLGEANSR